MLAPLLSGILLLGLLFLPVSPRLTVARARGGDEVLLSLPMKKGETFELTYTHSANKSPVADTIQWTGREMLVLQSRFQTFGAGIPIPADGIGTSLTKTDEGYVLSGIDKPMESFLLMTEEIPDHHILHRESAYRLNDLAGAGRLVKFQVKRVSLITMLLHSGLAAAGGA